MTWRCSEKRKERKWRQLQEEKEKKLLHVRSLKMLGMYKICDGAISLLQSSGTIGQPETTREKCRRAIRLSKAGLKAAEDVQPFRKKRKQNTSSENEVILNVDCGQGCIEAVCCDNEPVVVKCTKLDDCIYSQSVGVHLESDSKSLQDVGVGSNEMSPTPNDIDTCVAKDRQEALSILCSPGKEHIVRSQEQRIVSSNIYCPNVTNPADNIVKGEVNAPIVVHVSRPKEVEQKRKDLPIIMMEQEIMEAINDHSVVIICGETGCGKTTQVPQFLYEAGFGSVNCNDRKGTIGVTQPRRVAVLSTAKRVSYELGLCLGKEVGFQVRHDKKIGNNSSIKFMTDGILLREVQSDFLLKRYSIIILDEAHERSLNTDILVGMLSRVIKLRQKLYTEQQEKILSGAKISPENMITKLKLVLMSATLKVEDFISHGKLFHETPPILEVPVRQFPVTIHYTKRTHEDYLDQAYGKVMSIHRRLPPGGILVFVTGQREVELLCKKLRKASKQMTEKNSKRNPDSEISSDISEAFEIGSGSDHQTDRFSSYEDDDDFPEIDSYSSDTGMESELDDYTTEEAPETTDLVVDILRDSGSLSSLKASFEALAGKPSFQSSEEKSSLPIFPTVQGAAETAATTSGPMYVLPLYAMLPASAQLQVFEEVPEGERLVVVATNVAETSLTIPGIKYVVDTGKEKVKKYNYANGVAAFKVQWISKASAAQRAGRAGRTGPGHCYRLYTSAAFSKDELFPEFSSPEISRIPVDGVVLLMKSMGIDKVANFPFPTPPEPTALEEAEHCLKALDALDDKGRLTPMGRAMAQYPMSPRHSRMLLTVISIMRNHRGYDRANLVLGYAIATASALSFPNPFNMQFGGSHDTSDDLDKDKCNEENLNIQQERHMQKKGKAMAKEARARFCNSNSDALNVAYALQLFELAEDSWDFCKKNALHLKTMEDMSKLRKQLVQLTFHQSKCSEEFGWNQWTADDVEHDWRISYSKYPLRMNEDDLLCQAICAGWVDRIAKRVQKVSESPDTDRKVHALRYQSCVLNDTIYLHRWSSVSPYAPDFVVYSELLETKRLYMHGVTSVKWEWLVKYGNSLCSFSAPLNDPKPFYDPMKDQVLCWVRPSFGRHNWQLPLHHMPIKNDMQRLSVFASGLLVEGKPCLRSAQKFLAAPPSSLMRPEALGQRRVMDPLNEGWINKD